jgi:D-glycero-D-manno-heptose 1,7-bisphosphate phosphatase
MKNKGILLDRDGVINIDYGYIDKIKDFEFIHNSIKALRLLSCANYKLIIVTNQSGIGRGYYSIEDYNEVTDYMLKKLKENNIKIDRVYFCPHAPKENCKCRKPKIKMLKDAEKDFNLALRKSYIIGDKTADIKAGEKAGCKTVLVRTGKGGRDNSYDVKPDYIANDLLDAARWIKNNEKSKN